MTMPPARILPPSRLPSTQLNIVTTCDVRGALADGGLEGRAFMMDNSPESVGKGTPALETACRAGQVLNWLVYGMQTERRPDGGWPPIAKITNIVFLTADRTTAFHTKICADLKIYGAPDAVRSPLTPFYEYWAGAVLPDIPPGLYPYRLIFELDPGAGAALRHYELDSPALRVVRADYRAP